jgi:hypothetical protein
MPALLSDEDTDSLLVDTKAQPVPDNSALIKRIAGLPPFPTIALRLLAISTESETAIGDYEKAFKSDPALTMDLLQTANSVEFGLRARVESIHLAGVGSRKCAFHQYRHAVLHARSASHENHAAVVVA